MSDLATVHLKVLTPLFLAGADQQAVDLRVPSIRGQLRFWFRAAVGGLVGADEDRVRAAETALFGGAGQASAVSLRVRLQGGLPPYSQWNFPAAQNRGLAYLGYGLAGSGTTPARSYIPPGFAFALEVRGEPRSLALALGALWLWARLGGLGARARRGFGGLEPVGIDLRSDDPRLQRLRGLFTASDPDLARLLQTGLAEVRDLFRQTLGLADSPAPAAPPPFPVIAPGWWRCRVSEESFSTWQEALNFIGSRLRAHREDRSRSPHTRTTRSGGTFSYYVSCDYMPVRNLLMTPPPAPAQVALRLPVFGLPLPFQFQSLDRKAVITGATHDRRASPLHLRVVRQGEQYRLLLMVFRSQFLPAPENLRLSDVDDPRISAQIVSAPDWAFLEAFVTSLPGKDVTL